MNIRRIVATNLWFFLAAFALSPFASAQDVASITGLVTDATGAVVSGASITLLDPNTKSVYEAKTSSSGAYTISGVRPGPAYQITFAFGGFQSVVVSGIQLNVGQTRTQNARLVAGALQSVEVSAGNAEVTINTTDASIGNNINVERLTELPIQNRSSPARLFTLQPGVTAGGAITGARTDQTAVTVDDLDVNDIAAGGFGAIISGAPIDSLSDFRGTVAGQLSSNGPGSGGQFQLVTKNGTNTWHGDLNEYHRDTSTVANGWFNNNANVPRAPLIRNQFGGAVGGPILRDKAFFFFDFNDSRIIQSTSENTTVPLDSFRNGTLGYILARDAAGNACSFTSRNNTTPQCISYLSSAQVANLDPLKIGFSQPLLTFINSRYPHANDLTGGDGINTGGYRFTTPTPNINTAYVLRLDYNLNRSMKLFARGTVNRTDSTQTAIRFPGDPTSNPFQDRSYSYVVGHVWTIGTNKVNEALYGDTITKYNFASTYDPLGTSTYTFGGGTTAFLSGPYNSPSSQRRRVPIPMVRDDFSWQKGSHNITFGGSFKFVKTNSQLVNDFNNVSVGLGGELLNLNAALRPTNIRGGSTAPGLFDNAFTFALGHIGAVGSNYNYTNTGATVAQGTGAIRRYRFYQTELYAGDSWKATKQLTLTYGLRYQLYSVPYEANGAESIQNFTFNQYFAARVAQSTAGLSGDSSLPFITYNLGGKANGAAPLYAPSYKDFAPRFSFAYNPAYFHALSIRGGAGIIYDRTVVNAINFIQDQSSYLFQNSANTQYGTAATPTLALTQDPRLGTNLSFTNPNTAPKITRPYTPFVSSGTPFGLAGNEFNTAVDPTLKDPYSIVYNLGIEHELPGRFILKVNYVGRLGRRLLAQADASQLVEFTDKTSGQRMSTAFANVTQQVRAGATPSKLGAQPWFENVVPAGTGAQYGYANNTAFLADNFTQLFSYGDFADFIQALAADGFLASNVGMASQLAENTYITNKGFSSFNGLLVTLHKNLSRGLEFDFNYTWSHSIDNTSLVANSIASSSGVGFICDVAQPRACRGNSDFDQTTVINSNFTYDLPFGRGRAFLGNSPRWLDEVVGGWAVSGIPSWSSGQAFSALSNAFVAGYANDAPAIFSGNRNSVQAHPHKTSTGQVNLFSNATTAQANFTGPIGFQIGSRNNLRGPSNAQFDAGVAKTFPLVGDRVKLKFRADYFNVLNHPVFGLPNTDITNANFGQITSTVDVSSNNGARVGQFALRLEF